MECTFEVAHASACRSRDRERASTARSDAPAPVALASRPVTRRARAVVPRFRCASDPERSLRFRVFFSPVFADVSFPAFDALSLPRSPRSQEVPEVHRAADPQAAVPAPRPRNRAGLQDGPALSVACHPRAAGGVRGVSCRPLRGHQPVRHPRQARHHHAQGHPARQAHSWRARVNPSRASPPPAAPRADVYLVGL